MKYDKIKGLDKDISKLIMGNDNQIYFDEASKLWDHWIEVGGNAFDTAYVYGGGSQEKLLGDWHRKRNNLKDLVIIAKGAHTPNCDPESISLQLTESLERLKIDSADIYIMHRDNVNIPVDEFIDVLNDDLNTSVAISILFELSHPLRSLANQLARDVTELITEAEREALYARWNLLVNLASVLGLKAEQSKNAISKQAIITSQSYILEEIKKRKEAKLSGDFTTADKIRDELKAIGIEIIDKKDGFTDWIQN